MAERVIDLFQTVEVEHYDAEARARASTSRDLALKVLVERTVVAEAREVVCESSLREPRELLLTDSLDLAPVAGEATENH